MLAVLLVAVSLGMSNLAAAIAIGVSGVNARTRLRVGLVFGAFEAGMPAVGLVIGAGLAGSLGQSARWLAAGLLIGVGGYTLLGAWRGMAAAAQPQPGPGLAVAAPARPRGPAGLGTLLLAGLALSVDNLAVGFALGSYHTTIWVAAVTIGAVSVALALVGLELGARIGSRAGQRSEQLAGLILMGVGVAIATGALS